MGLVAGLTQPVLLHKNPEERMEFQGQFTPKPPRFRGRKGSWSRPAAYISARPKWKVHCQNVYVQTSDGDDGDKKQVSAVLQ